MIDPCWYKLKIDCSNALNPNWRLPDTQGKDFGVWSVPATKMFTEKWIKEIRLLGFNFGSSLVFYRGPNHNTYNAHIDIHERHPVRVSTYGLNWVIGGSDSLMTWYDLPGDLGKHPPLRDAAGTIYYNWPIDTLNEIDRCCIGSELTLTRVGVPHAIIMGNEPRWAISARVGLFENKYWKDIVQWMRDRDLLIEREDNVSKNQI